MLYFSLSPSFVVTLMSPDWMLPYSALKPPVWTCTELREVKDISGEAVLLRVERWEIPLTENSVSDDAPPRTLVPLIPAPKPITDAISVTGKLAISCA